MNFLLPVDPAVVRMATIAAPVTPQPGTRTPEVAIARFRKQSRESLAALGIRLGPPDPSRPAKDWADPDAKIGETQTYTVLTATGPKTITMSGDEATRFNIGGECNWPKPNRLQPSGVKADNGEEVITIEPQYLSTEDECDDMLADLGPDFERVAPVAITPKVTITVPPGETRFPWIIRHRDPKVRLSFGVGINIQTQFVDTAGCAPGVWTADPVNGLRYEKVVIPTTTGAGSIRVPVVDLPDNAVVESAGPIGDALQVYIPEATQGLEGLDALSAKMDVLLTEVRALRAEVKKTTSNPWE